jgi:hypothetical protein
VKLKEKPNTTKTANTDSTKGPLPIATWLHWKRKVNTKQQKVGPENTPTPPPIYITDVTNISPLVQLLGQIAKQQYEIKALTDNQVKVQPKTYEPHKRIIKALAEKRADFQTYKLKEERSHRVALKNMHYSINFPEIKTEIEKLRHTVTNIWNITIQN